MKKVVAIIAILFSGAISNGQTLLNSAVSKLTNQNYKGAIADCNKVIAESPFLGEAYQIRGTAKVMIGDYVGAIKDCNTSIKYKPREEFLSAAYTWRGMAKYQLGDGTSACADWRKGGEMGNSVAYTFISNYCH